MNVTPRLRAIPPGTLVLLLALLATGCAKTPPVPPRAVVMISLDGLAGFYHDDPKAQMPTLRQLAAQGASSGSMKASNPTVTWPNHTTLVTGVTPARHGVVGNNYLDRATGKPVVLIGDPVLDKSQIVKVPTLFDVAHAAGLKTAAVRWPATRNADALDWAVPSVPTATLYQKYTTPALLRECRRAGVWTVREPVADPAKDKLEVDDATCTAVFNFILREHRPDLALLHLVDLDHTQHLKGPRSPEAYASIKRTDDHVRQVRDEMNRVYGDRATLVVVSDHGFSPIEQSLFPNVVLRKAGLLDVKGTRVVGGPVRVVPQGGAAMVYVLDKPNRAAVIAKVKDAFKGHDGIERIVSSESFAKIGVADPAVDPNAPDVVLFAKEGKVFGDTAAGALAFREKPERSGSHGHDADFPHLHASFYAAGRGIKPGVALGEINNTDVAPTVASLLGLTIPNPDGAILRAALSSNDATQVAGR
jgi:predicted AlkP superfamily pyrophosphatase or phosphodiesterase